MRSNAVRASAKSSLLDTHCHIDRYPDPASVANEAELDGVITIGVTNLPSHFEAGLPHVRRFKRIRLALGLHPLASGSHRAELPAFKRLLPETSYVGEVGLDFSKAGMTTREEQEIGFREVLSAIATSPKFVTLHSRKAEDRVLDLLTEYGVGPVVFHWYSGPLDMLDEIIRLGHYFSINNAMVRAATGRAVIDRLPHDRVLTETDGPYVWIGRRPAKPADVVGVVDHLATTWNTSREETITAIYRNFKAILRITTGE